MPKPAPILNTEGEGKDALAFLLSGCLAALVLLPVRALLDLKQASAFLAFAVLCAGWTVRGRSLDASALLLKAWYHALWVLCAWAVVTQHLHRIPGNFGNAAYFAAFLVLSWPLALLMPKSDRDPVLALIALTLLATGSRAGLVALGVQLAVLAWKRPAWRATILKALAFLAAGAVWLLGREGLLRPTLRGELWSQTLRLALQHPFTGWGARPFALLTEGRWSGDLAQSLAASGQFVEDPHQLLLSVFFHGGLLGLALFAGAVLLLRYLLLERGDEAAAWVWLGCLGLLVQAQFNRYFFHAALLSPPLLFVLVRARLEMPPFRRVVAAAVAVILALQAWRPIQAWRLGVAPAAQAGLPAAAPIVPPASAQDPAAWDRAGTALAAKGAYTDAEGAFRQALALQATTGRAQNLGNCLMMQGRYGDAEVSFRQAVALDPKSADAQFSLGYALFEQKRLNEAVAALDEALRLQPGHAEASKLKEQILK
jgi:tetratricopeptide (TPR) repeat protein